MVKVQTNDFSGEVDNIIYPHPSYKIASGPSPISVMDKKEFKVIVVGNSGVGKSCLVHHLTENKFDVNTPATVGVDFRVCPVTLGDQRVVKMQLWDTVGQERFRAINSQFYRGAHGAFIVYDVTDKDSFDNLPYWFNDIKSFGDGGPSIRLLIGNKCDLRNRRVTLEAAKRFAKQLDVPMFETSAKNATNIKGALIWMAHELSKAPTIPVDAIVDLESTTVPPNPEKKCC